ncbi:ATP-binding protein (plasmid) [Nostoc sp. C057]|uniref:ATP-dependent nuclease n=1 Tax=Nostoc sp. C057 TaxID=2576903 RepID=UPI0015C301AD|nr:ATP-binding protein [Nostoc sp. C057]QLE52936.1 ATP-binding protein [Nostoc sp. C057]
MKIVKIRLSNIRGYENAEVELSPRINLLVGENNSGKTTILRTLLFLQDRALFQTNDIRKNHNQGSIQLEFEGNLKKYFDANITNLIHENYNRLNIECINEKLFINGQDINTYSNQHLISSEEPKNFIYPFLSKRKVMTFNEDIRYQFANSVSGNFSNLFAKVDRITTDGLPAKDEYIKACSEILGFPISSFTSHNGKKAVYIVDNFQNIPLELMGEGVANILGLILDLCIAKDKLFLIEEPENDIHPKALKKLLNLIVAKSETNQFVITTHSNIVLKYLGSAQMSKIFKVNMEFFNKIPTSSIAEVDNSPKARREILEDLGYELFDFDVWDTWLILEESSAEIIIRDFLIPNFVPELKERLRTCSSLGVEKVSARFDALHSLCLFFHLQQPFKDRIWVLVDGGENEAQIINNLKNKYKSWTQERFCQLKKHDFERYYPEEFQVQVDDVLNIKVKEDKMRAKKVLLEKVKKWCMENPDSAKEGFRKSAYEVIDILKHIEKSLQSIRG